MFIDSVPWLCFFGLFQSRRKGWDLFVYNYRSCRKLRTTRDLWNFDSLGRNPSKWCLINSNSITQIFKRCWKTLLASILRLKDILIKRFNNSGWLGWVNYMTADQLTTFKFILGIVESIQVLSWAWRCGPIQTQRK